MFDLKTRAILHYTTSKKKEIYKKRIMVENILGNKTLYADFPDDFVDITNLIEITVNRTVCRYDSTSTLNTQT